MKNCSNCHSLSKYDRCSEKKNKPLKLLLIYDFFMPGSLFYAIFMNFAKKWPIL